MTSLLASPKSCGAAQGPYRALEEAFRVAVALAVWLPSLAIAPCLLSRKAAEDAKEAYFKKSCRFLNERCVFKDA